MSQESPMSLETSDFKTKVVLDFFRHDEKDPNKTEPKKPDEEVELTPDGRQNAKVHGKLDDITFAIATATDRVRAQQTARYHMAGAMENVTGDETPAELAELINEGMGYGSKTRVDNRLNFVLDEHTPLGEKLFEAFSQKRYLKFLVEESDGLAIELNDIESSTYSRQASNVASIVLKYIEVAKNFNKLYESAEASDRKTNELQRFFGSHQGVTESFLAKLIEKKKGVNERDEFVKILGNQGFDFSEGFQIDIFNKEDNVEPVIEVQYRKEKDGEVFEFNEEFSPAEIQSLIVKQNE